MKSTSYFPHLLALLGGPSDHHGRKMSLALAFAAVCSARLNSGNTRPSFPSTYRGPPKSLS
ncbi:hypothetical protein J2W96_006174 [Variovorax guangxiensis]|nr:hypothetical protein [Variovorax guangxiensis]